MIQKSNGILVLVAIALCALALSEVVNLAIVAVALPNLMGALGANINDISLTMTSYMVSAAICMPLSGMVINKFGMRKIALIATSIFTIFTILCGTSANLQQMVIYRAAQGVGGAFFPAMAQAYILNNFTEDNRRKMMAVLTTCLVSGIVIGPSFGGFLVQNVGWSWIFYVNVPILIFAFFVILFFMQETKLIKVNIDYFSFCFFAIGIGCLELFFDQGNTYMWFQSLYLTIIFGIAITFLFYFFWRAKLGKSVINFKVFTDKNFSLCCIFLFLFYIVANAFMNYLPMVLQTVWGYQVDTTGYLLIPRGLLCFIFSPIVSKMAQKINLKLLMITSCLGLALSTWLFCLINLTPDLWALFISSALIAFCSIAFLNSVYVLAYVKIAPELINDAAGVFNFFRTFAGSVGASITSTMVTINQQISWHDLTSHISRYSHSLKYIAANTGNSISSDKLIIISSWEIAKQSNLLAFIGVFVVFSICAILLVIIPLFMENIKPGTKIDFISE